MPSFPDNRNLSEYKVVTIKKVYFDAKTFIWAIVLLLIGVLSCINSFKGLSNSNYEYILLLLFGLLTTVVGSSLFITLCSMRDKKVPVRKTDDEMLDEMIAHESIKETVTTKSKPKLAITKKPQSEVEMPSSHLSNVTITLDAYDAIITLDETEDVLDLIHSKTIEDIRYDDLLDCVEWKFMRLKVMMRDRFSCSICNMVHINNHAHHTYYIKN
ncbi:MAG: hypothetical protein EOO85_28940, partial [Pedobacter sp.]